MHEKIAHGEPMKMTNNMKSSTLKTVIASSLTVALLGTAIGGTAIASNHYNNHGEPQIYRDNNFGQVASQLRQNLRSSGYYVMDIQADGGDHINVYAKKNNKPYELRYTYPDLKLVSSKQKAWSKVWQDKSNHHNLEDKIKNESRYPTIKQSAINKLSNQGYKVTDIELDEQDDRGVFEVEAERGNQQYDIILSYPDLNTIKVEKD